MMPMVVVGGETIRQGEDVAYGRRKLRRAMAVLAAKWNAAYARQCGMGFGPTPCVVQTPNLPLSRRAPAGFEAV